MRRIFPFLFFVIIAVPFVNAQEDDYVINKPDNKRKKDLKKRASIDTTSIPNPDYTSYILSATAYTLEKNRIRLSGTDVVFIKGSYGITDNTMLSVNISALGSATTSLKQQINLTDNLNAGFSASGGLLFFLPGDSTTQTTTDMGTLVGGEGMVTLGDKQNNITFGTGIYHFYDPSNIFGNGNDGWFSTKTYIAIQKQLGRKIYLLAEGIYFTNYDILTGSLGVKFVVGDRIALNFGIMPFAGVDPATSTTYVVPIAIPLISFRMLLGRN